MSSAISLARLPAGLALGAVERTAGLAIGALRLVRGAVGGGTRAPEEAWAPERSHAGNGAPPAERVAAAVAEAPPRPPRTPPEPPPVPDEVKVVDDQDEVVAEFAERGAEEGAGPEVRADEPWDGYDRMTAAEIRQRLRTADAAQLLAVRLREAGGKGRSSILNDVQKRLG